MTRSDAATTKRSSEGNAPASPPHFPCTVAQLSKRAGERQRQQDAQQPRKQQRAQPQQQDTRIQDLSDSEMMAQVNAAAAHPDQLTQWSNEADPARTEWPRQATRVQHMKHTLQHLATHTHTRPSMLTLGRGAQTRYSCSRQQPAQRIIDTSAVVAPDSQKLGGLLETVDALKILTNNSGYVDSPTHSRYPHLLHYITVAFINHVHVRSHLIVY